jgi:two-component system phosphate regulon sensor histidine kinase PhoR
MRKLVWKIWLPYLLCLVGSFALMAVYVNVQLQRHLEESQRESMLQAATLASSQLARHWGATADLQRISQELSRQIHELRITVVAADGLVLADTQKDPLQMENHADRPEIQQALAGDSGWSSHNSMTLRQPMMYVAVPLTIEGKKVGVVRIASPLRDLYQSLVLLRNGLFTAGLLIILLATLVSFWLARDVARPLLEMREVAARFAKGDFSVFMEKPETMELANLSESMNSMAAELDSRIQTVSRQRNQLEAVLAGMGEGVIALSAGGEILTLNRGAARILHLDPAQALGQPLLHVIRHPAFHELHQQVIADGAEATRDIVFVRDGHELNIQLLATPMAGAAGMPSGVVLVINDVTRLMKLETMRKDFAANVSHELRTPLTSMKGFVETLQDGAGDDPETRRKFLDIIHKQTDRLNALVQDLLLLSQVERDQETGICELTPTALLPLFQETVKSYAEKAAAKRIALTLDCPATLSANANELLLGQAVANLIDNALKYSNPDTAINISAETASDKIRIKVADQGVGIAPEHLDRLFERFYRVDKGRSRDQGGTGLGLAIVKHVAELHRGRVTAESRVGGGSTFVIELPKAE